MQTKHYRFKILGMLAFFAQVFSMTATASELNEARANQITDIIRETAISILEISPDDQTFENTLKPWSRLTAQINQDLRTLKDQNSIQTACELYDFWISVTQNSDLQQALTNCSLKTANNSELNPFERYIGIRFINHNFCEPVYLQGAANEHSLSKTNFAVLNLQSGSLTESQIFDLATTILSENADVVCIQEVFTDEQAYNLYEMLKKTYAHFIYIPAESTIDFLEKTNNHGLLLASKFNMENAQFNAFSENTNDGFLDFVLKSKEGILGHIYAGNIKKGGLSTDAAYKFVDVINTMFTDILSTEEESIPFIFCGDLRDLQSSELTMLIKDTYLSSQNTTTNFACTLLIQPESNLLTNISLNPTMCRTEMGSAEKKSGLHSFTKWGGPLSGKTETHSFLSKSHSYTAQKRNGFNAGKLILIPVLSRRGGNDSSGTEGKIEGRITATFGGPDGIKIEISANGEVSDGKGNYVSGSADYNLNTGECRISVGGEGRGTICEKD